MMTASPAVLEQEGARSAEPGGLVSGGIVYIGAQLPKRSETFVYRELLGLRARGWNVIPVSVRSPGAFPDEPELSALAGEAEVIYGAGILFAPFWALIYPRTMLRALRDAVGERDLRPLKRLKLLVQACASVQLAWRLRNRGIVHVHAHMAHVPANFAMYLAHALDVPFSFTGHAADLFVDRQILARKVGTSAFVACISHWHREFYRSLKTGQDRFPVIRCGVDISQFKPSANREQGPVLKVAAVGRLVKKKGFDILIEALALRAGSPDDAKYPLSVDVIGGGPEEIRLREAAGQSGVQEVVAFRGEQPNGIVRDLLAGSDLFVLPCRTVDDGDRDGIPVVLMEAMASGVCVISGRLPAIEELVEHEVSGLLVPPDDAPALEQAISRLAGDAVLRQRLAAAGRRRVEEEFSATVNLERLEDGLRSALEPGGGS